jgi:hypothetical protein
MTGLDFDSKAPVRSSLVRVLPSGDMVLHISADLMDHWDPALRVSVDIPLVYTCY